VDNDNILLIVSNYVCHEFNANMTYLAFKSINGPNRLMDLMTRENC